MSREVRIFCELMKNNFPDLGSLTLESPMMANSMTLNEIKTVAYAQN